MYKKFYWWQQQQQHTSNGKNYIYFGKGRHTPNLEPNLKMKKKIIKKKGEKTTVTCENSMIKLVNGNWFVEREVTIWEWFL